MFQRILLLVVAGAALVPVTAQAHYLWVTVDGDDGPHGTANIYFEESAAARDGRYLDPFLKTKSTWIRTVEAIKPRPLRLVEKRDGEKQRWVTAALPAAAPRSIDSYWLFGVYQYGKTHVLLHYYARSLDVDAHEDLHELGRADQMALDIVPHDFGDELEVTVLWKGEPVSARVVHVRGPQGFKQNIKTDAQGTIRFEIGATGRYSFRTSVEEPKSGMHGEDKYDSIRHNATLIMNLPLSE